MTSLHFFRLFPLFRLPSSPHDPLPEEVSGVGFQKSGPEPLRPPKFTVASGPLRRDRATDELDSWRLFFNQKMVNVLLQNARNSDESLQQQLPPIERNLILYAMFVLALGLVQYPEEGMIFQKDHFAGLTQNRFLEGIFSHKQFQAAKNMFTASRGDLTSIFNETCQKLYNPSQ